MGGVSRTVVFGKTSHRALLQLFDPFDFPLETVANIDGETWIFGVEDVSLGASLKGVGMGFDEVFELVNLGVELLHFGDVIVLSLFDRFE